MDDGPVPVDILTGFLGSGKTSLIRRLIGAGALAETAILVNEFAGLPVDDRLVGLFGAPAALIGDTCLCCVADGNLTAALVGLVDAGRSGRMPPFRRILVETSGIADPAGPMAQLAADPMLRPRVRLGRVVTLVDLCHGAASLDDSPEAVAQLVAADIICLTKADLAPEGTAATLGARIAVMNPFARIAVAGDGDPFDRGAFPDRHAPRRFLATPVRPRHDAVAAAVLTALAPLDWSRFAAWLSLLLHRHGNAVLRLKGIVRISGERGPATILVQSVRHVVHRPEHLPDKEADARTALVVIARGLDPAVIEASFRRHVSDEALPGAQAGEAGRALAAG